MRKKAVIIGAGPAGLTAAYELLKNTEIKPVIFEMSQDIGGISRTFEYKGNRMDIGGHRFFSKSDIIMNWWLNIMPLQGKPSKDDIRLGRIMPLWDKADAPDPEKTDRVMLTRSRLSRIFFRRKFFDYPISLSMNTISNMGFLRIMKSGFSYIKACTFPLKDETTLENFLINRFGKELYLEFFKDYTQKVWGVSCKEIPASWGQQRIKKLSISKALLQAFKNIFRKNDTVDQKDVETSLISKFLYPKLGPGQLWEQVAKDIINKGGEIYCNHQVTGFKKNKKNIEEVYVIDKNNNQKRTFKADYILSSMPVKDLVAGIDNGVPEKVRKTADGLVYRDFITVGLLLKKLKIQNKTKIPTINNMVPDNWIYIQERDVKLGRLQIFNNWSPYMVRDENLIWIGLEYFCFEDDELWNKKDNELAQFAIDELAKIDIADKNDVLDNVVLRVQKAYPAYFGSYDDFHFIREYLDSIENLFLIGRNGMHRYNNQDHSMLTAMEAVKNINNDVLTKDNIWAVNSEQEYHEQK